MSNQPFIKNEVLELDSFEDVIKHVTADSFVLCDLDNTLIEANQLLGSVQWADQFTERLIASGEPQKFADELVHQLWLQMLPTIPMRLVDPLAPQIIQQIQAIGAKIIGLTARFPKEATFTHPQLAKFDIQFSNLFPTKKLDHTPFLFENGILFSGWINEKSDALKELLKELDFFPEKIVFIDDKLSHVLDIKQAAAALNIECVGIRFSKADKRVQEYNQEIVDIQWKWFPQFISDEQALSILTGST